LKVCFCGSGYVNFMTFSCEIVNWYLVMHIRVKAYFVFFLCTYTNYNL
jgi:hypothetical protein